MKIDEFRLVTLIIKENDNIIYDGPAENAPEELKKTECKEIKIQNGRAEIQI